MATVNIDLHEKMIQGTFEKICVNPVYYLQNNDSFSRIKGNIIGNLLHIICEDTNSIDKINWIIIAERCLYDV